MDINQLILIVKKKIKEKISLESIKIEDKTFLHKSHASHQKGKAVGDGGVNCNDRIRP